MERIPARPTPLIRNLPIRPDNGVTNSTLRLPLERTFHVPPPRTQCINQATIEDRDRAQTRAQPRLPLLLVDSDAVQALNVRIR